MMFLSQEDFATVVRSTPLISIDLIVENERGEFLLGKRTNRPAQGFWFVPGGRVQKDETLTDAFERLTLAELGLQLPMAAGQFYGVWQHFYDDNFSGTGFSTHYIVLGFRLKVSEADLRLPDSQHDDYRWQTPEALLASDNVHDNSRAYFLAERQGEAGGRDWIKYPIFGMVAAFTVPLFLNMISSTLLEGARTKPVDFYVFAGFCLIYVVASRRLFENIALRLLGQMEMVRRDVGQLRQKRDEALVLAAQKAEIEAQKEAQKPAEPDPREVLSYNDVEILRALAEERFVYGNLAALCERTGLQREFVSQRLTVMKSLGVIETRINDKNVLHWFVSTRGAAVLNELLNAGNEARAQ